jgi:tetratricopeptide (TPR) repeat protein
MRHRRPPTPFHAAALAVALALLPGCASAPDADRADTASEGRPAQSDALARAMSREARRPDRRAAEAPPPGLLDPGAVAPIAEDQRERAEAPLEAALASLDENPLPPIPEAPPPSAEAKRRALGKFIEGRSERLGGDNLAALGALEQAARLDPTAPEPWKEIGETRLAMSDRRGARTAFERALARDPDDQESAQRLALLLEDASDRRLAASLLARLWTQGLDDLDPAMRYVVPARLGEALLQLGYVRAGSDLIRQALTLPDRFGEATNEGFALAALYRRRGDLQQTIGDAALRMGDAQAAHDAYEEAARFPALDPSALLARRVYAQMRLGRPAHAVDALLSRVREANGRADDATARLLAYVVAHADVARVVNDALDGIDASLDPEERRFARPDLIALRAAVLGPEEAVEAAVQAYAEDPFHDPLLAHIFASGLEISDRAALDAAFRLLEQRPHDVDRVGRFLLRARNDPSSWLQGFDESPEAGAPELLLEAWLTARMDEPTRALAVLGEIASPPEAVLAADVLRVGLRSRRGAPEDADAILDALAQRPEPLARLALVRATIARGDLDGALELLSAPTIAEGLPGPEADALALDRARLLFERERQAEALVILNDLVERVPTMEEAHLLRVLVLAPPGPAADERAVPEAINDLRAAIPGSRAMGFLRAQDAIARDRLPAAIQILRQLTDDAPDDERAVRLLSRAWRSSGDTEDARAYFERLAAAQPGAPLYVQVLAEVLATGGQRRASVVLLESWLDEYPGDASISRLLEQLYRLDGDEDAARALARNRIRLGPATVENLGQLAALQVDAGDGEGALQTLARLSELTDRLSPEDAQWARAMMGALFQRVRGQSITVDQSIRIATQLCDGFAGVPDDVAAQRVRLLALSQTPLPEVVAVLERTVAERPSIAEGLARTAVLSRAQAPLLDDDPVGGPNRQRLGDLQARRIVEATEIAERMLRREDIGDAPELLALCLDVTRRATFVGGADVSERFGELADLALDHPRRGEVVRGLFQTLSSGEARNLFGTARPNPNDLNQRASLLGSYSDRLFALGDEPRADRFSRLALEYDPEHPMVNNNLGYRLLERGEDVSEAARMIRVAYEADRESIPVSDSMGWAQYKLGVVHDVRDDQGQVVDEGAVTILTRTLRLIDTVGSQVDRLITRPVVRDHLGDALWLAGRREDAMEQWSRAAEDAKAVLADDTFGGVDLEELEAVLASAQDKLRAAREDREPPIAPTFGVPNEPAAAPEPVDIILPGAGG